MKDLNGMQAREYSRAKKLSGFLSTQQDIYAVYPPFAAQTELFFNNNTQLLALAPAKDVRIDGIVTGKKADLKAAVATLVNTICTRVAAYAKMTGDTGLEALIYNRTSDIERLKDAAVLSFATRLVNNVSPLLANDDFQVYAVTQEMLDTLVNKAQDFDNSIGRAAIAQGDNSYTSRAINAVLKSIRGNVVQFNLLLNFFEADYPAFVSGYLNSSKVTDTGIRHNSLEGVVRNLLTGAPVQGVTITGEGKNKKAITDANGEYKLNKLKTGSMPITISAHGYDSQTATVSIIRGTTVELNVNLHAQVISMATA